MKKLVIVLLMLAISANIAVAADIDIQQLTEASNKGDAEAQFTLGDCYFNGNNDALPKDFKQAVSWYQKAAAQGHVEAQFKLGVCYHLGRGVSKDYKQAVEWWIKAAGQGHVEAQYSLSDIYGNGGWGLKPDSEQVVYWRQQAAEKGHVKAQYDLGRFYYSGKSGLPEDYDQTAFWFQKAADQGHGDAQMRLGMLYANGHGVPKSLKQACVWYTISAAQTADDSFINELLKTAKSDLTKEEAAEVDVLAAEWLKKHGTTAK